MAEETKTSGTEKIYTIPLRKEWLKEPRSKRSNRALAEVKKYLKRHTKYEKIMISKGINEMIFSRGFKKPPGKIRVEVKGEIEHLQAKLPGEVIAKIKPKKTGVAGGLKDRFLRKEGDSGESEAKKEFKEMEKKAKEATSEEKIKEVAEKVEKKETMPEEKTKEEKKEFKEEKKKK